MTKFLSWEYSDQRDQAKMDKVLIFYRKIQPDLIMPSAFLVRAHFTA